MTNKYGPRIITDGLVLCLDAADKNSYPGTGTSWYDLSGNGNDGTLTNGPIYNGSDGGYIDLDGIDDTVNLEYDLRSNWTYECWVNKDSKDNFGFLGQGVYGTSRGLHIIMFNDRLRFGMYSNDTDIIGLYSNTLTGIWYHYVFTYNHSTFLKQVYRDGVELTGSPLQTQIAYLGTGTVRIGATYSSGSQFANGKISSAKIYNRVLTPSEISQNYQALKSRYNL
jgi:hypothetical protein